jgi:hypothetical protein
MPIRAIRNAQDKITSKIGAADARITGKVKAGVTLLRSKVKNKAGDVKAAIKAPVARKISRVKGSVKSALYGGRTRHKVVGNIKGALASAAIKGKNKIESATESKKAYIKASKQYLKGQVKGKAIETASAVRRKWR